MDLGNGEITCGPPPAASLAVQALSQIAASIDGGGAMEHVRRVGDAAQAVAVRLGLADGLVEAIGLAAPLHDVGKVSIPREILEKPGPLTMRERRIIERHAAAGERVCLRAGNDPTLRLAARIARSHHERWDGRGYPDGLRVDQIPLAARIVAVVDVYDALVSVRPYKGAWAPERALRVIVEQSGTQFDPDVVDAFVAVLRARAPAA